MVYRITGFSLVEIMLAMALGLILLAGISQVYLGFKRTYRAQENIARLQENGRFATDILSKNIRMAGYGGCLRDNLAAGIRGFNSTNLPSYLQGKVVSGTDVIVIEKADVGITHLITDIADAANVIEVANNPATKSNPELFIADCSHHNKFQTTSFGKKIIKTNVPLTDYKRSDTEVAQYTKVTYFIGKTSYENTTALYSITNQGRKEELIAGVKNMQIKYGVDTNGNGIVDSYYSAAQILTWDKVLSVEITLDLDAGGNKIQPWKIYIALQERI